MSFLKAKEGTVIGNLLLASAQPGLFTIRGCCLSQDP